VFQIRQNLVKLQNLFVIHFVTSGFKSKRKGPFLVRCGSDYGGWWIPREILKNTDSERLLISAGLGFDVTFDEVLLNAGFEVIGLDPLLESVNYAKEQLSSYPKFTGLNMGLWKESGRSIFYAPRNESHDSWSTTNLQKTYLKDAKEFSVISLVDLISRYPSIRSSDYTVLKMDVEGSEEVLIPIMMTLDERFDLIEIEMDFLSLIPFFSFLRRFRAIAQARKFLNMFESNKYLLIQVDHFNFIWQYQNDSTL